MNQLFPLPLYSFLKILLKNGGVSPSKIKNLSPWLIKTILFEPLRWAELAAYNHKISQTKLDKHPVFVLGYYRSGTSYLQQLMTMDDRLGYHSNFQMVAPEIMLGTEKALLPVFEWVSRVFRLQDSVHRVPLSFRFPGEEDVTMTTFMHRGGAQWGYFFPGMMAAQFQKYVLFEGITENELNGWKQDFAFLLQKISIANQHKQLVLKSPPNTARIKVLLSLYPEAKFVFIHRNPYDVYISNKKFWEVIRRVYALERCSPETARTIILDTYSKMMQRYLAEKDLIPEGQLIEMPYDSFVQDTLGAMRTVYEQLHLGDFDYCEGRMRTLVESRKDFVPLQHTLPATETAAVNEVLEPFILHWNYPLQ